MNTNPVEKLIERICVRIGERYAGYSTISPGVLDDEPCPVIAFHTGPTVPGRLWRAFVTSGRTELREGGVAVASYEDLTKADLVETVSDEDIDEILATTPCSEARAWLADAEPGTRLVSGTMNDDYELEAARILVEELYRLGAKEVTAVRIEQVPRPEGVPLEIADGLIVQLPEDPDQRRAVLLYEAETLEEADNPREDRGQSRLLLWSE
jgi:hypothetical protein